MLEQVSDRTGRRERPRALAMLAGERPRNVGWTQAAGLLYGDWGTSRLYVLGLAFFFASGTSFWLIAGMSGLILAVGWAYTQICRIYPDGGGVYTAARHRSRMLAVVGALLLFADYTVTASLSALDAFHYFGLGHTEELMSLGSPGLWAIVAIGVIGAFNLLGPKHTGGFAIVVAAGMMVITLMIAAWAVPQVRWERIASPGEVLRQPLGVTWVHFVGIVLALSGVEAIANLTGVMKKPVARTARRAIWVVAIEVALFNLVLAAAMVTSVALTDPSAHKEDMLAFLSLTYIGPAAEVAVRAVGGVLLLSATNTAITDMTAVQYLMARDGELPSVMQGLNRLGVPWAPALVAAAVPAGVLVVSHDLEHLAALYAIGVVGAVAINVTLCATHVRLRGWRRKGPMLALGLFLVGIWVTLACTKLHALAFVTVVMAVGLSARGTTRWVARRRGPQESLLRRAVVEQLPQGALSGPKVLVGTYGSVELAGEAVAAARERGAALVVCFVREVSLSYKHDAAAGRLTAETDLAARRTFARYLEAGFGAGVAVIPVYEHGPDAAEAMAEAAAMYGCEAVLIGSSRRGAVHRAIKGSFQRRLERVLPAEIAVKVLTPGAPASMVAG